MVKIILNGCCGHMGRVISGIVAEDSNAEIVAGIDPAAVECGYPVFKNAGDCDVKADVMIDFSSYKAVDSVIEYCAKNKLPLVECTTGLTEDQIEALKELSKNSAVLRSANMSMGINTIAKLLADAVKALAPAGFDIEIVEKHHNRKKDAPSGTALLLADAINDASEEKYEYTFDRSTRHEARNPKEIGISAVRGGSIVGEHEIIFAGTDEVIEIKHTAYSRSIFGKGAVEAAKFIAGKTAGMYDMQDVIG